MDDTAHTAAARPAGRTLRIAIVTETYPPEINGVAMTMGRLVAGLLERGHHVELTRPRQYAVEVPAQRPRFEELLVRGVPVPRYEGLKLGMPSTRILLRQWRLRRPDVVHLVTEGPLGWSALRAARALGIAVASDFHTNFHTYAADYGIGWLRRPITAYLRRFHNRGLRTIVPTVELRDQLRALGFRNLEVVARGVDTGLFAPARRDLLLRTSWRAEPDDPVVINVGRMAREKNLDLLFDTYAALLRVNPRTRLVVVGDGPERIKLVSRYPKVIFSGERIGSDLAAHYASADLFVNPSLTETYGNVTVEALASGVPVVAYRYAAAAQHVRDGGNGVTVRCGERDAFIDAAIDLLSDADRRKRMGSVARATMLRVDWQEIVAEFEAVLSGLSPVTPGQGLASARAR
jgi:glycosyltransferase involved in cell wall biosynthesis